jgi:hypothetical protein
MRNLLSQRIGSSFTFLEVVTGVADPRDMKRYSAGAATNLRALPALPNPKRELVSSQESGLPFETPSVSNGKAG